jgi:HAD superfamily hydrolase (TIGR01549 family)
MAKPAALLDVDGTLVDNNYQHALAWHLAIRRAGILVPVWKAHRAIGIGSDKIIAELAGEDAEAEHGDAIRDHESEIFGEMKDDAIGVEGATEFVAALKERGHQVILASSGDAADIEKFVELLEIGDHIDAMITSDDVDASKPEPDLIEAALERVEGDEAVMVGDTVWDVAAAKRAGIEAICVLSGGFAESELREAGAVAVYESVAELRESLDDSPLA